MIWKRLGPEGDDAVGGWGLSDAVCRQQQSDGACGRERTFHTNSLACEIRTKATTKSRRREANLGFSSSCLRVFVVAFPRDSVSRRFRGPDRPLLLLRHRREALEHDLLQPLPAIRLGHVDVALRVGRDAVHGVELARL